MASSSHTPYGRATGRERKLGERPTIAGLISCRCRRRGGGVPPPGVRRRHHRSLRHLGRGGGFVSQLTATVPLTRITQPLRGPRIAGKAPVKADEVPRTRTRPPRRLSGVAISGKLPVRVYTRFQCWRVRCQAETARPAISRPSRWLPRCSIETSRCHSPEAGSRPVVPPTLNNLGA